MNDFERKPLSLKVMKSTFNIYRFNPGFNIDSILKSTEELYFLSKTSDELSLIISHDIAISGEKMETGFKLIKVMDELNFSMSGVLSSILNPLADAEIPVLTVSTFDTDYFLIKEMHLNQADAALSSAGFSIYK